MQTDDDKNWYVKDNDFIYTYTYPFKFWFP